MNALVMHKKWCIKNPEKVSPNPCVRLPINSKGEDNIHFDVLYVMSTFIDDVVVEIDKLSKSKQPVKVVTVKETQTRKAYSNVEKMKAVNGLDNGMLAIDVASKYGVNRSMITRWKKSEDVIANAAASDHKKRLFIKNRRRDKHTSLLSKLFIQFQDARNKGRRCSHTWIYTRAKQIHKRDFPNARPLPKSIVVKFVNTYKIKCLRVQRRKQYRLHPRYDEMALEPA